MSRLVFTPGTRLIVILSVNTQTNQNNGETGRMRQVPRN